MDFDKYKTNRCALECFAKNKLPENDYKLIIIGSGEKTNRMENWQNNLMFQTSDI